MANQTPLYEEHLRLGGKIVDFSGWEMPLHYGSQLDEHNRVRESAGMFDVSHMTILDLQGIDSTSFLRRLLANNIDRLHDGKALYSCMLNEDGGIIDDLIVYRLAGDCYRMIVNAGTHDKDLAWIHEQAKPFSLTVNERTEDALIAIQGPTARDSVHALLDGDDREATAGLKPFNALETALGFIARTGYTGEDGYEIMLPAAHATTFWRALYDSGIHPVGLGARDTLRLEAGMALYGTDMDETVLPMEAGLGWTVDWEPEGREFIGRHSLKAKRNDPALKKLVGLVLEGRGVLRGHQKVFLNDIQVGEITSGSFSPFLKKGIAFARVSSDVQDHCQVEVRGKLISAKIVKPPFVRHGKACYTPLGTSTPLGTGTPPGTED